MRTEINSIRFLSTMKRCRTVSLILSCACILHLTACFKAQKSASHANIWSVDNEGWVVTKDRFFAIGTWHVPGYIFTADPETDSLAYARNESLFKKKTSPFNMLFMNMGNEKEYMSDKIHILNPFSPILHGYLDRIKSLPDSLDKDYYRSQYLKKEVDNPAFIQYIDSQIIALLAKRLTINISTLILMR